MRVLENAIYLIIAENSKHMFQPLPFHLPEGGGEQQALMVSLGPAPHSLLFSLGSEVAAGWIFASFAFGWVQQRVLKQQPLELRLARLVFERAMGVVFVWDPPPFLGGVKGTPTRKSSFWQLP